MLHYSKSFQKGFENMAAELQVRLCWKKNSKNIQRGKGVACLSVVNTISQTIAFKSRKREAGKKGKLMVNFRIIGSSQHH